MRNVDVRYAQSLDAFLDICNRHAWLFICPFSLPVIESLKSLKLSPNVEHCIVSIADLSKITIANNKWVELSADGDFYRVIFNDIVGGYYQMTTRGYCDWEEEGDWIEEEYE